MASHTPFPWAVGAEGVIAPTVPFVGSREYAWNVMHALRMGRPVPTDYPYYGGELVCETCSVRDQELIVTHQRQIDILMPALSRIAEYAKDEAIRREAKLILHLCEGVYALVKEEGRIARERYRLELEQVWMREDLPVGLLTSEAGEGLTLSPDRFAPSFDFVTDTIELAWEARRFAKESGARAVYDAVHWGDCPF